MARFYYCLKIMQRRPTISPRVLFPSISFSVVSVSRRIHPFSYFYSNSTFFYISVAICQSNPLVRRFSTTCLLVQPETRYIEDKFGCWDDVVFFVSNDGRHKRSTFLYRTTRSGPQQVVSLGVEKKDVLGNTEWSIT